MPCLSITCTRRKNFSMGIMEDGQLAVVFVRLVYASNSILFTTLKHIFSPQKWKGRATTVHYLQHAAV